MRIKKQAEMLFQMKDKISNRILFIVILFLAAFALSLIREEYLFGMISLGFSIAVFSIGFFFARHSDRKNAANILNY